MDLYRGKQAKHHSFMLFVLGIRILPGWKQPPLAAPFPDDSVMRLRKRIQMSSIPSSELPRWLGTTWPRECRKTCRSNGVSLRKPSRKLGVSKNRATPKWTVYTVKPFFNGWKWGVHIPLFSETSKNLKRLNWFVALRPCPILTCINFHAAKLMRSFSPRRALEGKNGVAADVLSKNGTPKRKWNGVCGDVGNLELPWTWTYCFFTLYYIL